MSDIVTNVSDLTQSTTKTTNKTTATTKTDSTTMGKDEFLKLLVTQMKYQDPLNPAKDTDFIAQLAQFSSLEQMQNLNTTSTNAQAFSLVGKEVTVTKTDAAGKESTVSGTVDYVTMQSGKAFLSIDGTLYSSDKLVSVMDSYYAIKDNLPSVETTAAKYDKKEPADIKVNISLGKNGYDASSVAVLIDGTAVDTSKMSYANGVLTISKEALSSLEIGKHNLSFVFNDTLKTTITDKVTVAVSDTTTSTGGGA